MTAILSAVILGVLLVVFSARFTPRVQISQPTMQVGPPSSPTLQALPRISVPLRTLSRARTSALRHRPEGMGALVVDRRSGEVLFSDGAVERWLGLERGRFLGTTWRSLIDTADLPGLADASSTAAGQGVYRCRHADGTDWVPFACSWRPHTSTGLTIVHVQDATLQVAEQRVEDLRRRIDSWAPPESVPDVVSRGA